MPVSTENYRNHRSAFILIPFISILIDSTLPNDSPETLFITIVTLFIMFIVMV